MFQEAAAVFSTSHHLTNHPTGAREERLFFFGSQFAVVPSIVVGFVCLGHHSSRNLGSFPSVLMRCGTKTSHAELSVSCLFFSILSHLSSHKVGGPLPQLCLSGNALISIPEQVPHQLPRKSEAQLSEQRWIITRPNFGTFSHLIWLTWHNPTCFVHIKQSLLWILKDPILKIPISEHFLVWWFVNILSKNILKSMKIPRHPLYTSSNFNLQLALYLKCDTG